ncbi:MAG: 1-phosphofructokinase [Dehalococcoidia bacterium]|nr:1-phosphofructokinase [Dehalococcoidia bacterium]
MIATVTLNPSLDRHVAVEDLILDDTNRWLSYKRESGGKGINVSRVVKELGGKTIAYGLVGGFAGRTLRAILKQQGVPYDFTPIKAEIRSNFIITDLKTHCQTRISAPGPRVSAGELKKLMAKVISLKPRPSYMVMAGSVPPGVPYYIYRDLIHDMKALGITTVLDSADLWLQEGIKAKPDVVKPNVREAQTAMGVELTSQEDIVSAVKTLIRKGINIAAISCGREGMVIGDKNAIYRVVPPSVDVMSTVGAGDSSVAGLVFKLSGGGSLEEASRFAVAAGTAATMTPGTELCHKRDVELLLPLITVERLPL